MASPGKVSTGICIHRNASEVLKYISHLACMLMLHTYQLTGSQQSLALLFSSLAVAVKQIAGKVSRAGLEGLYGIAEQQGGGSGDTQKKLDVVAVSNSQGELYFIFLSRA